MSSSESSLIIHKDEGSCSMPLNPLLPLGPHSGSLFLSSSSSFNEQLTLALDELSAAESFDLHSSIPLPTFILSSIIPFLHYIDK